MTQDVSLENYLQEAGRAGRDRDEAKCVLLYTPDDVERQFGMSARSRLTQREIQSVLRSLRNLDRKRKRSGEVVATSGEILAEEKDGAFERDTATDDTRVRTAVAWLEEAALLQRDENLVTVFPSSLRVKSIDDAREKLAKKDMVDGYRTQLLQIVEALFEADPDDGISTDDLMGRTGLSPEMVRKAMSDLESLGISSNDMALTAFVHVAVADSSAKRLEVADALERDVIETMRETAPDLVKGESSVLHLRHMTQHLKDKGHQTALPEYVRRIVKSISEDGRSDGGIGSIRLRSRDSEHIEVTLQREWSALAKTAQLRRDAAVRLLGHLLERLPSGAKGKDLLAETTMGDLLHSLKTDTVLVSQVKSLDRLLERGLMWMHEQDVIRLNKGLAVFRPAMTIRLEQSRRGFTKSDFSPLELHYEEQVIQIHVMDEYVQRGLAAMADAMRLAMDYFRLGQEAFLKRWMPTREKELKRQTTPASWRNIVESLGNSVQQSIVTDEREQTNVLVLAGPGSGKTRVLVHRIAFLIRVRRERPDGILALAYNRHAAVEIRRRLRDLIGEDARGVMVMTCHAMAMRLVGASFAGKMNSAQSDVFSQVLWDAIALLKGEGLPAEDADEQRDRLLAGFRWILVDEYQDIAQAQYDLISALAGRTRKDEEGKISLFAVGDDDQNIYAFNGASVDFIRRFESDYDARATFLVENYRSTANIVAASNAVIAPAKDRMKVEHPIQINQARLKQPAGDEWEKRDPVGLGRVQLLSMPSGTSDPLVFQAAVVMRELDRLRSLDPDWAWTKCAVIAREWRLLDPVRAWCEHRGIPVQTANEDSTNVWRLRETQELVDWIHGQSAQLLDVGALKAWVQQKSQNPWWELLQEALEAYGLEMPDLDLPGSHLVNWLAEWGREARRKQSGVLLLTAHRAKGLEFDHVAILDGKWNRDDANTDRDDARRLFYVAMTRARKTLIVAQASGRHRFADVLTSVPGVVDRVSGSVQEVPDLTKVYLVPSLRDVDIGFSGRSPPESEIHRAIAAIQPGDKLQLKSDGRGWVLLDARSNIVGRMARAFSPPIDMTFSDGHVLAIQSRNITMTEPDFEHLVKSDSWEVVIPELVFAGKSGHV